MADTLEDLAARCESATGPDRTLDGLIEVARDPMRETVLYNEPGRFPQKAVRGPIKDLLLEGRDLADYIGAPKYTAALDAAVTLVPDGYDWAAGVSIEEGLKYAFCGKREAEPVHAATSALALTAAALRAIAKERG